MNFVGHAVLAAAEDARPGFVLGAMLPDLTAMVGLRLQAASDPVLAAGVAFHHRTDHAFHDAPTFRELASDAWRDLLALGVSRGPARAVAHVGVELLLDAELARDAHGARAYLAAVHPDAAGPTCAGLVLRPAADGARLALLCLALHRHGLDPGPPGAAIVTRRLAAALARRPRLALSGAELPWVEAWAGATAPRVAEVSVRLRREVEAGLAAPPPRAPDAPAGAPPPSGGPPR